MKKTVIGILAHVDAGKTTLAESILYVSGTIRRQGSVDGADTTLDTHGLEKARGITIFTGQAHFKWKNTYAALLDTPGHVDFCAEAERVIRVLDAEYSLSAELTGSKRIRAHLWGCLKVIKCRLLSLSQRQTMPALHGMSL